MLFRSMALRDDLLELHHALLPDAGAPGEDNIRSTPGIPIAGRSGEASVWTMLPGRRRRSGGCWWVVGGGGFHRVVGTVVVVVLVDGDRCLGLVVARLLCAVGDGSGE